MPKKIWQKYYTRPTRTQDFEVPVVLPLFYLSKNKVTECAYIPYKGKWQGWYPKKEFENYMKILGQKVFNKNWTLKKHLAKFHKNSAELKLATKKLSKTSNKTSLKQLEFNYKNLFKAYLKYSLFIFQPWSITHYLENWLINKLKNKYENWLQIYETIAKPTKSSQMQQMFEAIWQWKINGQKNSDLQKIINKYSFLGVYSVNDPAWTRKDLLNQVGSLKNCQQKIKKTQQAKKNNQANFNKIFKKLQKDSASLAKVAEVIHEYIWLRDERVNHYKQAMHLTQPFYRHLERKFNLLFGFTAHLSYQEIINTLKYKKIPSFQNLQSRDQNQYIAYITKNKTTIIVDQKNRTKFLDKILDKYNSKKITQFKGQIAFSGKVTGIAQIILTAQDCYKFKSGNILIANMTHPDFLPAIRKAKAIVTEEGGIICHAAIISRELKIPCIVGTKIATQVLKDGNKIEVNANTGIIKILKYAKK